MRWHQPSTHVPCALIEPQLITFRKDSENTEFGGQCRLEVNWYYVTTVVLHLKYDNCYCCILISFRETFYYHYRYCYNRCRCCCWYCCYYHLYIQYSFEHKVQSSKRCIQNISAANTVWQHTKNVRKYYHYCYYYHYYYYYCCCCYYHNYYHCGTCLCLSTTSALPLRTIYFRQLHTQHWTKSSIQCKISMLFSINRSRSPAVNSQQKHGSLRNYVCCHSMTIWWPHGFEILWPRLGVSS